MYPEYVSRYHGKSRARLFSVCGAELTDSTGLITSPNYPNNYPHERECVWTIAAPDGNQVLLNVTDFLLESHASCAYDFLEIRYTTKFLPQHQVKSVKVLVKILISNTKIHVSI